MVYMCISYHSAPETEGVQVAVCRLHKHRNYTKQLKVSWDMGRQRVCIFLQLLKGHSSFTEQSWLTNITRQKPIFEAQLSLFPLQTQVTVNLLAESMDMSVLELTDVCCLPIPAFLNEQNVSELTCIVAYVKVPFLLMPGCYSTGWIYRISVYLFMLMDIWDVTAIWLL